MTKKDRNLKPVFRSLYFESPRKIQFPYAYKYNIDQVDVAAATTVRQDSLKRKHK